MLIVSSPVCDGRLPLRPFVSDIMFSSALLCAPLNHSCCMPPVMLSSTRGAGVYINLTHPPLFTGGPMQYEYPSRWSSFFEDLIRVMLPGCCAAVTPGGPMVLGPVAQASCELFVRAH